jgi:hypothetical protein
MNKEPRLNENNYKIYNNTNPNKYNMYLINFFVNKFINIYIKRISIKYFILIFYIT